jgi:hypothetical protein
MQTSMIGLIPNIGTCTYTDIREDSIVDRNEKCKESISANQMFIFVEIYKVIKATERKKFFFS